MRIYSTPLPPSADDLVNGLPSVVMAFDTLVDEKRVVVGLAIGQVQGPDLASLELSNVGFMVLDRCVAHFRRNYPDAPALVFGVTQVANAVKRVRQLLANAPDQSLVMLLCADHKVYDAAYTGLGVDAQAMNQGPHH